MQRTLRRLLYVFLAGSLGPLFANFTAVYVAGEVTVGREGSETRALRPRDVLQAGDTVSTGANAFAALADSDDTVLKISPLSQIVIKTLSREGGSQSRLFNLTRGKVLSRVAKLGKGDVFQIQTPTAIAGVRGTVFITESGEGRTRLWVLDGQVGFHRDGHRDEALVKENHMAIAGGDEKPVPRLMTPKDREEAVRGVPVRVQIEDPIPGPSRRGAAPDPRDLKNQLRQDLSEQRQRQDERRDRNQERSQWDAQLGRTVRVGNLQLSVVERFRKTGNTVRLMSVTGNPAANRVSVMDLSAFYKNGVPSLAGAITGGDVLPTTSSLTLGARETGKTADVLQLTLDNTLSTSRQSATVSGYPGKVFTGSDFAVISSGGIDYLVLRDGAGEAYRFTLGRRVIDGHTGADLPIDLKQANVSVLMQKIGQLGNAVAYLTLTPGAGTGVFHSGAIDVLITADYLPTLLTSLLGML